jgi:nicotinate phosphoribosyltransferase
MDGFRQMGSMKDVHDLTVGKARLLSATHEEILSGETTDVYFVKTLELLRSCGCADKPVVAEVFARGSGIYAGLPEVLTLFQDKPGLEVESLAEGDPFGSKETIMRIRGPYSSFGMYETVLLGMLASASGWATAARECVEAAGGKPVLSFGARHVHPAIASVMERTAVVAGGCQGASCILGAKLAGVEPRGTIPHAAIIIVGDTLEIAETYDRILPEGEPRIILVDTFKDEAEETLRVAKSLGKRLGGIRLDTPGERGGVTADLVREIRWRLDQAGAQHVQIIVSGGLNPDRIRLLGESGADAFGVGSYIAHATPRDMTMDIKMVDGRPVAKRGRLPGLIENTRLRKVQSTI